MEVIAVVGATGFLGRHLINSLALRADFQIRALSRKPMPTEKPRVHWFTGDLLAPHTFAALVEPQCTVVNLAHLGNGSLQDNISAVSNLAELCRKEKIRRFVHCSTATVVGQVSDTVITENMMCDPATEYEATKLAIERTLINKAEKAFELAILRPTAIFGPGGKNLLKLAHGLSRGQRVANFAKSCLFDRRKMNLVYVDNVVAAIEFLLDTTSEVDGEVFIVSDDGHPWNNYRDIETKLMASFGISDYGAPRFPLHPLILSIALKLLNKSNVNPHRIYVDEKLRRLGFAKPVSFEIGLALFANWYETEVLAKQQ